MHFDGRDPEELEALTQSSQQAPRNNRQNNTNNQPTSLLEELSQANASNSLAPEVRPINPSSGTYSIQEGSTLSLIQTILFFPFTLSYKVVNTLFYFLSTLFPFLPRFTGYYPANRSATHSVQKVYDPKDTAAKVIRTFEETYGEKGIKFFEGGFAQAFDEAKKDLKFLLVILQSDEHDATSTFNKEVLTDSKVVEFLKQRSSSTIVWLGNVANSEGLQISESLKCTTFPFVLLLAPAPKSPRSSVVVIKSLVKLEGEDSPGLNNVDSFISAIEEKMEAHMPIRATLLYDKKEREMERRLREEQDEAYQRSLEQDRERARKLKEEKLNKELKEREQKAKEEEAARQQELLKQNKRKWRLWRIAQLGPEYNAVTPVGSPDGSAASTRAARINIRAPDGTRIIHKFRGDQTLDDVYAFWDCHELMEELGPEELQNIYVSPEKYPKPSSDYVHTYEFELVSSMPRKDIPPSTTIKICEEKAIWPSGTLLVESFDDSSEEDEDEEEEEEEDKDNSGNEE